VAELKNQGELKTNDVEAVATALSGAMNELALWIAAQRTTTGALRRGPHSRAQPNRRLRRLRNPASGQ
jgi:hypothetical protein